jgi:pimeloyl-ACP methyl ester carboxylesterase
LLAISLLQATAGRDDTRAAATPSPATGAAAIVSLTPAPSGEDAALIATGIAAMLASTATAEGSADYPAPDRTPEPGVSATYPSPSGSSVIANVAYDSRQALDIYVPTGPGPHPTVVLVRGGPSGAGGRSYLDSFARGLASTGLLVFNADYRDIGADGGGYPAAFQDVACVIRFARAQAVNYDGDGGQVTLIGHSLGGWVGSVVALNDQEFTGDCPTGGSGRPDAFVGLAGNYDLGVGGSVARDLGQFFGGPTSATAAARAAGNPFTYGKGSKIPIRLVAGTADGTVNPSATNKLNAYLAGAGWDVGLTMVPGGTHMSILWSSYKGGAFAAVFSAIAAARR